MFERDGDVIIDHDEAPTALMEQPNGVHCAHTILCCVNGEEKRAEQRRAEQGLSSKASKGVVHTSTVHACS